MKFSTASILFVLVCIMAAAVQAKDDPRDRIKDRYRRSRYGRYGEETDEATLDRIKKHDEMRTKRMRELIEQRTQQLKDHETGHRRLSEDVRLIHVLCCYLCFNSLTGPACSN